MTTHELRPETDTRSTDGVRSCSTCWTMVRAAAAGEAASRSAFVWRYEPVVRAYLHARWKGARPGRDIEDTIQDVFLECFREGGALTRASDGAEGRSRTFLFAVTRNVARRAEESAARRSAAVGPQDPCVLEMARDDESSSRIFDRTWARHIVHQARDLMETRAREGGERASRRALLLKLRFHENRPIREIAREWDVEAAYLHHEFATARREFAKALRDVVAFHQPGAPEDVDKECARLQQLLRR